MGWLQVCMCCRVGDWTPTIRDVVCSKQVEFVEAWLAGPYLASSEEIDSLHRPDGNIRQLVATSRWRTTPDRYISFFFIFFYCFLLFLFCFVSSSCFVEARFSSSQYYCTSCLSPEMMNVKKETLDGLTKYAFPLVATLPPPLPLLPNPTRDQTDPWSLTSKWM